MRKKKMTVVSHQELRVEVSEMLTLHDLSRAVSCDPEFILELSQKGVIEFRELPDGEVHFMRSELPRLGRGLRLLNDLDVDISSLGLVLDLLERIDHLEDSLKNVRSELQSTADTASSKRRRSQPKSKGRSSGQ